MVNVDTNIDLTKVDDAMADVEQRGKRLYPAFRELRRPLRLDQRDHAHKEEGPSGSWPPRSPFTEARRKSRNRGVRRTRAMRTIAIGKSARRSSPRAILGRIPKAVLYTVGALFIRGRSRVAWSAAHQRGLRVGRGVTLPARPFLWLSETIVNTARDVIGAFVVKGWKR